MDVKKQKAEVRSHVLKRLRAMTALQRKEQSTVLNRWCLQQLVFLESEVIGVYAPLPSEPDIWLLIEEAWQMGKTVVFPSQKQEGSFVCVCSREDFVDVYNGVLEPTNCLPIWNREIDLLIVPCVGITRSGQRLGRGKGFYDRLLHNTMIKKSMVLAYAEQACPSLPVEAHDYPIDIVYISPR